MNLRSNYEKLAQWWKEYQNTAITAAVLIMAFFAGLGLGLLIKSGESAPIIIDKNVKIGLPADNKENLSSSRQNFSALNFGNFVASINGKAYYPKNCKAANVIKEENRIWFGSAEEAQAQGYAPAKNCP